MDNDPRLDIEGEEYFSESELEHLALTDLPRRSVFRVGQSDEHGTIHVEWDGCIAVPLTGHWVLLIKQATSARGQIPA